MAAKKKTVARGPTPKVREQALAVQERLSRAIPNPHVELKFANAWQLIIATILAAQSTDRDIWAEVAAHAAALPRRAGEELPAEDGGLPSVSSRIARLHPGAGHPAVVTLDAAGADAIEDELREPKRVLAKKIIQDCVHA